MAYCNGVILRKYYHYLIPDFQLQNTKKDVFCDGLSCLCRSLEKLENNTNGLIHFKTRNFDRFAMDYSICADIDKML